MNRRFGIEIESLGFHYEDAANILREKTDLEIFEEDDDWDTYDKWQVKEDCSLSSTGCEFASPVLTFDRIGEVKTLLKTLRTEAESRGTRFHVDRSCGLHVHIDANDLRADQVTFIAMRYRHFHNEFDSLMPISRRRNNNDYCRDMYDDEYESAKQMIQYSVKGRNLGRIADKYRKVNVSSWVNIGTIEFRQHSGTLNYKKIRNWVAFLQQFVEESLRMYDEIGGSPLIDILQNQKIPAVLSEYIGEHFGSFDFKFGGRSIWIDRGLFIEMLERSHKINQTEGNRIFNELISNPLVNEYYSVEVNRNRYDRAIYELYLHSKQRRDTIPLFEPVKNIKYEEEVNIKNWLRGVDEDTQEYVLERIQKLAA